jgi:S-DNA-T family DNA segregation ATPase FtsK/SpoIIIE
VVTGLIKANFPARMSFSVASSIDSRVILDTTGAEHLLGSGDMLFLPPEAGSPIRVQGVWITDHELEKVVDFWQKSSQIKAEDTPPWDAMLEKEAVLSDRDGLIEEAIKLVQQTQRASISMLQRQLRIGYPRAARLIDELEDLGVVGESQGGGKERDVLINEADSWMDYLQ